MVIRDSVLRLRSTRQYSRFLHDSNQELNKPSDAADDYGVDTDIDADRWFLFQQLLYQLVRTINPDLQSWTRMRWSIQHNTGI